MFKDLTYIQTTRSDSTITPQIISRELQQFMGELKDFLLYNAIPNKEFINDDDFSPFLLAILILVKSKSDCFNFQVTTKGILLTIKRVLDYSDFQLFVHLFEELTLQKLPFKEKNEEWSCELILFDQ